MLHLQGLRENPFLTQQEGNLSTITPKALFSGVRKSLLEGPSVKGAGREDGAPRRKKTLWGVSRAYRLLNALKKGKGDLDRIVVLEGFSRGEMPGEVRKPTVKNLLKRRKKKTSLSYSRE